MATESTKARWRLAGGAFPNSCVVHLVPCSHDDAGNLWLVKEGFGEEVCATGTPVKCGATVRW